MNNNVDEELKRIIGEIMRMDISDSEVEKKLNYSECDLMDDLGLDSLLMVELIVDVENFFGIEFDFDSLDINILRKYMKLKEHILKQME